MIINYENIIKYYVKAHIPFLHQLRDNYKKRRYERRVTDVIAQFRQEYQTNGAYPLFSVIEIETLNRCNNSCSFCPVNKNADTREYKVMDRELFLSILTQLKELNYAHRIHLYSNNEPFLDERIVDFARLARETLPQVRLVIYTNGTLLTLEKFKDIMQYLDRMVIDNYNDKLQLSAPVKKIHDFAKHNPNYNDRVRIRLRKLHDVLTTRGGQAPNRADDQIDSLPFGCLLPFRQMIVRPDGKISLCCNDALGKFTMGDLSRENIADVWNNAAYLELREKIAHGRAGLPMCSGCDSRL